MEILLSRTQAGPGRAVEQEQEVISPNHVTTIISCSVGNDVAPPVVTHEITELFSMGIGGLQRLKSSQKHSCALNTKGATEEDGNNDERRERTILHDVAERAGGRARCK